MKNGITVRQLTKDFKTATAKLKPGQSVPVTNHGAVIGRYTKAADQRRARLALRRVIVRLEGAKPAEKKAGQRLMQSILRDVA